MVETSTGTVCDHAHYCMSSKLGELTIPIFFFLSGQEAYTEKLQHHLRSVLQKKATGKGSTEYVGYCLNRAR